MRSVLMISTALLILAASGCAKQPATMPASASAPAPGASAGATGGGPADGLAVRDGRRRRPRQHGSSPDG